MEHCLLPALVALGAAIRALALACALTASALAQPWPNRTVRIVATSPPGGSVDFLARALASDFGEAFGQPFVVENRPGANGNIGVEVVMKAPADGHTMFVSPPGPFSINLHLMTAMPFDPGRDIAPVAMLAVTPLLLVVHPSVPARNLPELLAWLRAQNGAATYASQAIASTGYLAMELMKSRTGVEATHVPYKGSAAQAAADLLAGRVSMGFISSSTTLPHVASGRLRAIGVAELKRIRAAPDIPTLDESGLPGFEATPWLGLGTRAGTPREIIDRLAGRASLALARPETAKRMASLGIEPRPMGPSEFAEFLRADSAKWAEIIRRSGAKLE
ncbi:MAG TPA: tripartite tricarboxylate transporter substrate-binding protein [Burkholderiales bacterium]|nr:tripartite tricarboxylate transporter substrate-binding protein [Burkholderiales bacterium]